MHSIRSVRQRTLAKEAHQWTTCQEGLSAELWPTALKAACTTRHTRETLAIVVCVRCAACTYGFRQPSSFSQNKWKLGMAAIVLRLCNKVENMICTAFINWADAVCTSSSQAKEPTHQRRTHPLTIVRGCGTGHLNVQREQRKQKVLKTEFPRRGRLHVHPYSKSPVMPPPIGPPYHVPDVSRAC